MARKSCRDRFIEENVEERVDQLEMENTASSPGATPKQLTPPLGIRGQVILPHPHFIGSCFYRFFKGADELAVDIFSRAKHITSIGQTTRQVQCRI
jgi:hypothetical protein